MNTRNLLTLASLVCMAALAACGSSEPVVPNQLPTETPPAQAAVAPPTPPAEQFIVGLVHTVDADAKKLVLKDLQGAEHTFAYSPTTKITGIPNAKELDKQEGRNATVRYTEADSLKSAVQIHIEISS